MVDAGKYGGTSIAYAGTEDAPQWISVKGNLADALTIDIADRVSLFERDMNTGEFSLNHEAGHFLYLAKYPAEYIRYYNEAMANGTYESGGHGPGDESGKLAKKLGAMKDIPSGGIQIKKHGN